MNIIICGAGMVGFSISKQLQAQGHSVTVIDQSSEDIKKINETQDVKGIVGRATLPSVLENAGAKDTDMIIAVTRNDEINMIVCQIASSLFNVSKKIARIRSQDFLEGKWSKLYSKSNIPIDVIISPEREVAKSLHRKLEAPGALDNVPFVKDKVKLLEILIENKCPLANIPLKDLTKSFLNLKRTFLGLKEKKILFFSKKNDQMKVGDKVYLVVSTDQIKELLSVFGHDEKVAQKILIIGGGNIGMHLAKLLETSEGLRIKIIEKNKNRAEQLAGELSSSIVICGDPLDEKILKEANIEEIETVFALTDDDEDNIMACVLAEKYTPSKRTIAIINKQNYSLLQESLKIDDLVDPRMATVSTIMKHVHMGTIDTVYSLLDGKYEFLEAKILETSDLVNKSIKESNLPEEVRIGAIVRKNKVIMPKSNFIFEKDDIVVVLSKREQLKEVEDIFRITS